MHAVFGIEPRAISNYADLRYVVEKFGFSKGLLIAPYPSKWQKYVLDACKERGIGDIEYARVVERLAQIKSDRLVKFGLAYDASRGWIENATAQETLGQFDALLVRDDLGIPNAYRVDAVPEAVFEKNRERRVPRQAQALAAESVHLLRNCKWLTLVDPYFNPQQSRIKVLDALVALITSSEASQLPISIHIAQSKCPVHAGQFIEDAFRNGLRDYCGSVSLKIYRWDDAVLEFDMHARYLLTDLGGMRYDRGFVEPPEHDKREMLTDVSCLASNVVDELLNQFEPEKFSNHLVDVIEFP